MPASISLLTLPLELQVEILKYLPLTALLTLKQVNRGLHNLILEEYEETRPEKISSVAIWEYLCFAERWPDLDPEQREPVRLTCYGCLQNLPKTRFGHKQGAIERGCKNAYGRCCSKCDEASPPGCRTMIPNHTDGLGWIRKMRCGLCKEFMYGETASCPEFGAITGWVFEPCSLHTTPASRSNETNEANMLMI